MIDITGDMIDMTGDTIVDGINTTDMIDIVEIIAINVTIVNVNGKDIIDVIETDIGMEDIIATEIVV